MLNFRAQLNINLFLYKSFFTVVPLIKQYQLVISRIIIIENKKL